MTTPREPDRILRAWLDLMPDEAPDRVIDAVLDAVETTPQRGRPLGGSWRVVPMLRPALIAAVAALVVAVGAFVLLPRTPSDVGRPGPSASASPPSSAPSASADTASAVPPPAALLQLWMGPSRDVSGLGSSVHTSWKLTETQAILSGGDYPESAMAAAFAVNGSEIRLTGTTGVGCTAADVGRYGWSLSPKGSRLSIAVVADPCTARSTAFNGEWYRIACKAANSCFGDVEAGTYPTTNWGTSLTPDQTPASIFGSATYTLPDGWAVAGDHTSDLRLVPSADYATETPDGPANGGMNGIEGWIRPAAIDQTPACAGGASTTVPRTAAGLTSWLASLPSLETTKPVDVTIDGHPGRQLDVRIASSWKTTCGFPGPSVIFLTEAVGAGRPIGDEPYAVGLTGPSRLRITAVDLGGGRTVVLIIRADDPTRFDSMVAAGTPIIRSLRFH